MSVAAVSTPAEFEQQLSRYLFERSEEARAVRVGEKETSEQAAIVERYRDLFSRAQLASLHEAEGSAGEDERERLFRLRKTCESSIVAAELAEREDALENAILAARVDFRGEVPHERVPAVLAELDIFALPSRAEGFGVAALEAAAMELPVVASGVHGLPDVVEDGRSGLLVPPGDADALAGALGRLVADAGLRAELGRAGRVLVERCYRWEENAAQMERLYAYVRTPFTQAAGRATVPETNAGAGPA